MGFDAKIHADSVSPAGVRLTTFEVAFPRPFLAEFNTHRVFSRNSASSRAIPVEKMLARAFADCYIPQTWGKNQKGMQASEDLTDEESERANAVWLRARDAAAASAKSLIDIGVHKQLANRLLEPFLWHTCIVTATEWSNFFHLRNNPMAQPEIQIIARMMQQLYESSEPKIVGLGEWHLPLIRDEDRVEVAGVVHPASGAQSWMPLVRISTARCGRVSFLTHTGMRDIKEDLSLHNRLIEPGHMSPFEHAARPMDMQSEDEINGRIAKKNIPKASPKDYWFGNLRGWVSYRSTIPGEEDILGQRKEHTST